MNLYRSPAGARRVKVAVGLKVSNVNAPLSLCAVLRDYVAWQENDDVFPL